MIYQDTEVHWEDYFPMGASERDASEGASVMSFAGDPVRWNDAEEVQSISDD